MRMMLMRDGKAMAKLEECAAASEEYQSLGGWSRMGGSCGEYKAEAVMIL